MRPHTGPTTGALTLRALARHPRRVAFAWDGGSLSYAGAAEWIGRMQAVFVAQGLVRGQCMALLAGNRAVSWCAGVAAQAIGLRTTPLHPMGSLTDQTHQVTDAGADVLVVDAVDFGERGAQLAASVPLTFTVGPADYGLDLVAAAEHVGVARPVDLARADDVGILNYTGGTTGRPKGVVRRHGALTAATAAILSDFELPARPNYLAVAPISHVAGSKILPTLLRGGTVHLMDGFDAERVIGYVEREHINTTLLVPTMIYAVLDHPAFAKESFVSLELLLYGASPMSPSRLHEGLERIGPVFSQLYGQTECYPIAVLPKADHDAARPDLLAACGFPVTSCDVTLLDYEGQPVADGELGEICVRAPQVMEEYWRQPSQTAEAFAGGWLHTSDIARRDDQGRLYIVDRTKDMIVSGGFNVYPKEIEDILTAHPAVALAAVIGVPDPKWGEAVTAVVVRRPGATLTGEELIALVKRSKGNVQAPKHVDFVDALPLTAVGKVDKKALRAPYWAAESRQVG